MAEETPGDPSSSTISGSSSADAEQSSFASLPAERVEAPGAEVPSAGGGTQATEQAVEGALPGSTRGEAEADSAAGVLRRILAAMGAALGRGRLRRASRPARAAARPVATIHLGRDDDMAIVQAKLGAASHFGKAVLVVPGGSRLFRREVDFARLRRWVAGKGLTVVLVSHDPRVRTLARRHGLPISRFVGRAQRRARSFTGRKGGGRSTPSRSGYQSLVNPSSRGGWEEWLLLLVLIVGAAVMGAGGALLVWPQATVTVVPQGGILEQQVQLTANTSAEIVDEETMEIPARLVRGEIKGQAQVSTLAYQDAPDAKATGRVVFVNRTNEPVEIPAGSLVATSTGTTIRFATVERATLQAGVGSVVQVDIEALDPGPSGNVAPFLINRLGDAVLSLRVRVTNEQATEGGSVKQVGMVTAADKERLQIMLLQQLQQEAHARLEAELVPDEFLPIESVSVDVLDETYDHLLGEATEFLGMTMRVRAQGVVFDLDQARSIARAVLERAVPNSRTLLRESFYAEVMEAMVVGAGDDDETFPSVQLVMKARGWTEASIAPERVIRLVQGRTVPDAVAQLQAKLPLEEPPLLSVEPDWWDRVPWLPFRIRVIVVSEKR